MNDETPFGSEEFLPGYDEAQLRNLIELGIASHSEPEVVARLMGTGRYRLYVRPDPDDEDFVVAYLAPVAPEREVTVEVLVLVRFHRSELRRPQG